jgi:hypothetical protein
MALRRLMEQRIAEEDARLALVILSEEFCDMCDAFGIPDDKRLPLYDYLERECKYPDGVPPHWRNPNHRGLCGSEVTPNFIECMDRAACASRAYAWHIRREHGPGLYDIPWVPPTFKLKIGRLGQFHYLYRSRYENKWLSSKYQDWQQYVRFECRGMRLAFDRAMVPPHKDND